MRSRTSETDHEGADGADEGDEGVDGGWQVMGHSLDVGPASVPLGEPYG